jgi:predicted RNA binding protein YcfA (HicA-like mRNA interferase family)
MPRRAGATDRIARVHWCSAGTNRFMTLRIRVTGKDLISALGKIGFEVSRIRGSHHFLRHPDGRATSVPVHAGETIGPGLLSKILRDTRTSREELLRILES